MPFEQSYAVRVKPVTTAPRTPHSPQGRDTFQTPHYATDLLVPFLQRAGIASVWECAVGGGYIAEVMHKHEIDTWCTDIRDGDWVNEVFNFITEERVMSEDAIVTNPPFSIKDLFIEKAFSYNVPFAFLINADYSQKTISWIRRGCQKIVPTSRIAYITPNIVNRVNEAEGTQFVEIKEIPNSLLYKYSSAQFHSMWLTYGLNLGASEIFVDLSVKDRKENIL